ncbi:hypothetical protein GCM10010221_54480 [Streptomyces parvus]|nr:hypothetical protein GCM10010221_54480 [Streptomyces parvus]
MRLAGRLPEPDRRLDPVPQAYGTTLYDRPRAVGPGSVRAWEPVETSQRICSAPAPMRSAAGAASWATQLPVHVPITAGSTRLVRSSPGSRARGGRGGRSRGRAIMKLVYPGRNRPVADPGPVTVRSASPEA